MKSWPLVSLQEVCIETGQRDPRLKPDEAFSYVDIAGIDRDTKTILSSQRIIGSEAPSRARKEIKQGDVLVSTVRPNLNAVAIVPPELDGQIASTGFCVLRADLTRLQTRYLYYFVRSKGLVDYLVNRASGANYPAVTDSVVKSAKTPLPPLAEQERLVRLLDEADALRRLRARADARTSDFIPALFHEMFGDPWSKTSKWPIVTFETLTTRITYGFTNPMKHLSEGIPIVTAKNVQDRRIDFSDIHYADINEFEALTSKSKPEIGDVLVTKDGTIGRCAVVETPFPLCINQSVALIRPDRSRVMPEFIVGYLRAPSVASVLQGMGKGQALRHLQITELAKMPIPLPPLSFQEEFAARVAEARALEEKQAQSKARLEALFESMLARAFAGEL